MFLYNKNEYSYLKTYRSDCFGSKNFSMYANVKLEYFLKYVLPWIFQICA